MVRDRSHLRRCSVERRKLAPRQLSAVETGRKSCFLSLLANRPTSGKIRKLLAYLEAICVEECDESNLAWYRIPLKGRTVDHLTRVIRANGINRSHGPFWGIGHTSLAPGSGEIGTLQAKTRAMQRTIAREKLKTGSDRNFGILLGRLGIPLYELGQYPVLLPSVDGATGKQVYPIPDSWPYAPELWERILFRFPDFSRVWYCADSHNPADEEPWITRIDQLFAWIESWIQESQDWPQPLPLPVKPSKSYGEHYGNELRSLSLNTGIPPIPETGSDYVI